MNEKTSYETIKEWVDLEYKRVMAYAIQGICNLKKWAEESTDFREIKDLVERYEKFHALVADFKTHAPTFENAQDRDKDFDRLRYFTYYGTSIIEQCLEEFNE